MLANLSVGGSELLGNPKRLYIKANNRSEAESEASKPL